jgi:2-methylcitrate dehydratase PrpD
MPPTPTSQLAAFIAELTYEDLPPRVRERVKDLFLDALASALAGQRGDETAQIGALARAIGASDEASVIGGSGCRWAGRRC